MTQPTTRYEIEMTQPTTRYEIEMTQPTTRYEMASPANHQAINSVAIDIKKGMPMMTQVLSQSLDLQARSFAGYALIVTKP